MNQQYIKEHNIGVPYEGFAEFTRKVAADGLVLIKNDDKVLPILKGERVSVFGRAQIDFYRSGTGSGGAVNVLYSTNLIDGLSSKKDIYLNQGLIKKYKEFIKENPFDNGGGAWAAEPPCQKEMPVTDELVKEAAENSDKAIIVIGRSAGEDRDNTATEGSYYLKKEEVLMMEKVTKYFDKVIVILNTPNIINMRFVNEFKGRIQSILYVWQGGIEGGNATADVLVGEVSPSGKLTDTIAYNLEDYPSAANFGDDHCNLYQEDVYVGYRYFETFAPDKVQYEFGYGTSYTTFDVTCKKAYVEVADQQVDDMIHIEVTVKNTGDTYAGKEVVQVYVEAPQGKLGQPTKKLVTFGKSKKLAPSEEELITLTVPIKDFACYDDSGVTGKKSCMVIEAGEYGIYVGTSVKACEKIAISASKAVTVNDHTDYTVKELIVVEELEEALSPVKAFTRMKPGKRLADGSYELTYEEVPTKTYSIEDRILSRLPETIEQTGNKGITLQEVKNSKATMEEFIAQLTTEELAMMVRGEGMCHPKVTPGTASAFGGVCSKLNQYGIPLGCTSDGPSGIRMEGGYKATQVPIGTLLASTWDTDLIEEMYVYEGKELLRNEIDTLLGPGMNIHRHPLNGRNFEYFSEDPIITGRFATAQTKGILKGGSTATLKHFACNNQEHNRFFVEAVVSERALREIYLKGFEMAVKVGKANSIMTTYNPLNKYWNASSYDLDTTILRNEWGFKGIVMTDWWARMNHPVDGGDSNNTNMAAMVRAQNDLYMVVPNEGAEINCNADNTLESVENGTLTVGELQRCAMNICGFLMNAPVFSRKQEFDSTIPFYTALQTNVEEEIIDLTRDILNEQHIARIPFEKNGHAFIKLDQGEYIIVASLCNVADVVAQSACNLLINDEIATTIQLNGTYGGFNVIKLDKVELEAGNYKVGLALMTADMQIEWMEFRKIEK